MESFPPPDKARARQQVNFEPRLRALRKLIRGIIEHFPAEPPGYQAGRLPFARVYGFGRLKTASSPEEALIRQIREELKVAGYVVGEITHNSDLRDSVYEFPFDIP